MQSALVSLDICKSFISYHSINCDYFSALKSKTLIKNPTFTLTNGT